MPATNQMDSGRCWMFGTLNLFRFGTCQALNVSDFEFSESYLYFFYLLEQANYFLEIVIETADKPLHNRALSYFLDEPIGDGGDWDIAINLLEKYGVVPKVVYPETQTSSNTDELVDALTNILKATAATIRSESSLRNGGGGGGGTTPPLLPVTII